MSQVQFIQVTPEELKTSIVGELKGHIEELKQHFQPKEPTRYITRKEVAEMLQVDLTTVHNLTVKQILTKYQIGGRVLYKRAEVEAAIVKI